MPSIQALLNRLERPIWLQDLAADLQSRAVAQLALPLRSSSAAAEPGVYAPVISNIYSANQQTMRTFQSQRVAFQPAQLVNQSWASQIQILKGVASAGDLLYSAAVHAEIVNATSRLMQQISSVATCLYARACQTLPIDKLDWAEFLMGTGVEYSYAGSLGGAAKLEYAGLRDSPADPDAGRLAVPADRYHHTGRAGVHERRGARGNSAGQRRRP